MIATLPTLAKLKPTSSLGLVAAIRQHGVEEHGVWEVCGEHRAVGGS